MNIDRRTILKGLTAIPLLAAVGSLGAVLISYLKPTTAPLQAPTTEKPLNKDLVAASLDEFKQEWDVREFVFVQETVEYSARGKQASNIPGFAVRIPNDKLDPTEVGVGPSGLRRGYGVADYNGQKYSLVVVSRICAHLGCIFQYHTGDEVCTGFNYCGESTKVAGKEGHPLFSCPCHLSVYNPILAGEGNGQKLAGLVVSGPAPRPPFPFDFTIEDGKVIIKAYA